MRSLSLRIGVIPFRAVEEQVQHAVAPQADVLAALAEGPVEIALADPVVDRGPGVAEHPSHLLGAQDWAVLLPQRLEGRGDLAGFQVDARGGGAGVPPPLERR